MDSKEKEQLAQEQLDELKEALKKTNTAKVEDSSTGPLYDQHGVIAGYEYTQPTYNQHYNNAIVNGGYMINNGTNSSAVYTTATNQSSYTLNQGAGLNFSNAGVTLSSSPWWGANTATSVSGKLKLDGENADIEINGVSLMEILQERLNVLVPNPKLEQEWDELKELGDRYRALEKDLKEKSKMWNKLKKKDSGPTY